MSDAEAAAAAPPKSKKMLIIIIVAVLVLGGAGAAFFMMKKNADEGDEDAEEAPAHKAAVVAPGTPPAYLPLDNMVVNLADPGGERVAQIGVTLELGDAHEVDVVKAYVPAIRSQILLLISQRTADELLSREGKEKLTEDIMEAAGSHFEPPEPPKGKKKKKAPAHENPVHGVLFSSFIVQ